MQAEKQPLKQYQSSGSSDYRCRNVHSRVTDCHCHCQHHPQDACLLNYSDLKLLTWPLLTDYDLKNNETIKRIVVTKMYTHIYTKDMMWTQNPVICKCSTTLLLVYYMRTHYNYLTVVCSLCVSSCDDMDASRPGNSRLYPSLISLKFSYLRAWTSWRRYNNRSYKDMIRDSNYDDTEFTLTSSPCCII